MNDDATQCPDNAHYYQKKDGRWVCTRCGATAAVEKARYRSGGNVVRSR